MLDFQNIVEPITDSQLAFAVARATKYGFIKNPVGTQGGIAKFRSGRGIVFAEIIVFRLGKIWPKTERRTRGDFVPYAPKPALFELFGHEKGSIGRNAGIEGAETMEIPIPDNRVFAPF